MFCVVEQTRNNSQLGVNLILSPLECFVHVEKAHDGFVVVVYVFVHRLSCGVEEATIHNCG